MLREASHLLFFGYGLSPEGSCTGSWPQMWLCVEVEDLEEREETGSYPQGWMKATCSECLGFCGSGILQPGVAIEGVSLPPPLALAFLLTSVYLLCMSGFLSACPLCCGKSRRP